MSSSLTVIVCASKETIELEDSTVDSIRLGQQRQNEYIKTEIINSDKNKMNSNEIINDCRISSLCSETMYIDKI